MMHMHDRTGVVRAVVLFSALYELHTNGLDLEYDSFGLRMKGLDVGSVGG